jgi:DNA polymerase III epsilon subunit-like protein
MYYFLDTETTGIDANASVCEIAFAITDENFNILEQHQSLIDPEQPISPSASGVHGLTWDDCMASPTLTEYFSVDDPSCYGKKLAAPAVLLGHRCGFDLRFVAPYFEEPPLQVDSLRWARRLYPDSDNHQLSTLIFALNLPRSAGAHRAMADVMSAMHLCRHICERTGMTLPQLAEASKEPMEIRVLSFGKHKGTPFSQIPRNYLRWMRENMTDLDQDHVYTINRFL